MGGGAYTTATANAYVTASYRAHGINSVEELSKLDVKQVYTAYGLYPALNPYGVIRECCDCAEHPETIPIILALDVTGSMGEATRACAAQLNQIMEKLYEKYNGIEFMMMGIGDVAYDRAPLQVTQFESDVRILDQTTKIYFEGGGGGNAYESYTAAWYFGLHHTKLDCWNRGKRGIIITMGDEELNPSIPRKEYEEVTGQKGCYTSNDKDIDSKVVYDQVKDKYDIYHINIEHGHRPSMDRWNQVLGKDHVFGCPVSSLAQVIAQIIVQHEEDSTPTETIEAPVIGFTNEISW